MSIKFRVLEVGWGGGGSDDLIFMGARIFLTKIGLLPKGERGRWARETGATCHIGA